LVLANNDKGLLLGSHQLHVVRALIWLYVVVTRPTWISSCNQPNKASRLCRSCNPLRTACRRNALSQGLFRSYPKPLGESAWSILLTESKNKKETLFHHNIPAYPEYLHVQSKCNKSRLCTFESAPVRDSVSAFRIEPILASAFIRTPVPPVPRHEVALRT
jgi:hypothetical protein